MKLQPKTLLIMVIVLVIIAAVFDYQPLWGKISSANPWHLGLDLAGGSYLVYNIDLSKVAISDQASTINGLRDMIERRVNLFGVSEPRVYTEQSGNETHLVVELAGIKDINTAIKQIGLTPYLEFMTISTTSVNSNSISLNSFNSSSSSNTTNSANSTSSFNELPSPMLFVNSSTANYTSTTENNVNNQTSNIFFVPTGLTGRYLKNAQLNFDNITRKPEIDFSLTSEGAKLFEQLTAQYINKPICIFIDNKPIIENSIIDSCPTVQNVISGGNARITGNFSLQTAEQIVERFNAGALPAPITLINQQTISPELGIDSFKNSIIAGIVGTLAVMLFMMLYYRKLGLGIFAVIALIMYIILTLALFKIISITITLAGIAGFILSIGMAVDANILVFERTKEELKRGLPVKSAIEEGFKRAWSSIRDSNISTMITSFILFYFTSSFIKGFAFSLFLGVIVSMFSAITITRTLLRVFVAKE
ncbi:MAG: protein translocase subunit SecD [Minisyncoccia bacterium]